MRGMIDWPFARVAVAAKPSRTGAQRFVLETNPSERLAMTLPRCEERTDGGRTAHGTL